MHRLALASLLLIAAVSGSAFAADLTCPPISPAATSNHVGPENEKSTGLYQVDINKGKALITSAVGNVKANQTVPINVSEDRTYLSSYKADVKTGQVELIPAVHSDGLSLLLNVKDPLSADASIDYHFSLTELDTIKEVGAGAVKIQVPIDGPSTTSCGSLRLARGQSQTFAMGTGGLTATITRLD
jgi:hypothetical protein